MLDLHYEAVDPGEVSVPDLSPRPESSLEWWFVQGRITGETLGPREFMISFFRQAQSADTPDGHMLLVSALDPANGRHCAVSQISSNLFDNFNRTARDEMRGTGVDGIVVDAFLNETATGGPARPVRLAEGTAVTRSQPLAIRWNEFAIEHTADGIDITFVLPGDGRSCRLRALPQRSWFEGRDLGGDGIGTMAYDCCPRLQLSGTAGGETVSGEAWMDHQWGDYGWMRAPNKGSALLGWDWIGINLDDGRDFIVMVHRDMRTRDPVARFAVMFDDTGTQIVDTVTITGLGEWFSHETMADYPVRCRIEIPELSAVFEFEPLAENQEISVFGLINTIWEGAGTIRGTLGGSAVSGRARLELHGYGYVTEFKRYQKKWVERIDRTITEFLPQALDQKALERYLGPLRWSCDATAHSKMLSEPVWDLLYRGGKRWRPIFGLLLVGALGKEVAPFELLFSVIPELVHNGSVIIDNIEDASDTRRGQETLHRRYGLPTAINAGNTLYFLPLLSIAETIDLSVRQRDAIYRHFITMFIQAHFGQAQDLYWAKIGPEEKRRQLEDDHTEALILQAHAFKSAAAVRTVAELACIVADADLAVRDVSTRLGESWGTAFQIIDDVNNFSTAQHWGKIRGEDVIEGKITYALHKAVRLLLGADKDRLLEILTTERLRSSEAGLAEALALIEKSGALEVCRRDANALFERDWPVFSALLPNSREKIMLRAMLDTFLGEPYEM
ncbi:MAG: polyprenyl synthetase family protein [Hyphomicrobiales bacterium]|nr:polyprenyl synthetase family protein [Hyphomicrobiales bacterium]